MRLESNERGSTVTLWVVIGLGMTGGTGYGLLQNVRAVQPDFASVASALFSSVPLLLFFVVGVVVLGATAWTIFDLVRNKMWVDVEMPVLRGGKLRAMVTRDRPLAAQDGQQLEAALSCVRRETRWVDRVVDGETKREVEVTELPVWSAKQAVALAVGERNCSFEFEIPADALQTDQAAASTFSAAPGIFWTLAIELPGKGAPLRSYRVPVDPKPLT